MKDVARYLTVANAARAASWVVLAAIVVATLSPIDYRPNTGHVVSERALAFALLGLLWGVGYPNRRWSVAAGVLAVVVLLELGQGFVPSRHGHLRDGLEKLAGGGLGLLAAIVSQGWLNRRRRPGA